MKPFEATSLKAVMQKAGDFTEMEVMEAMNIFEEYSRKENGEANAGKLYNINAIFSVYVAGYIRRMKDEKEEEREAFEARKKRLALHLARIAKDIREKRTHIKLPAEQPKGRAGHDNGQ